MLTHLQLNTNLLTYWFHSGLGILYNSYISYYI